MTAGTARLVEDSGSPGGAGATRRRAYVTPVTAFQDNRPGEGAGAGLKALFQPPHEILTDLPFEDARALAREQRRVLCCNLQVPSDFSSHRLNRDVWSDESVQALVTQGLVLYQQHSSERRGRATGAVRVRGAGGTGGCRWAVRGWRVAVRRPAEYLRAWSVALSAASASLSRAFRCGAAGSAPTSPPARRLCAAPSLAVAHVAMSPCCPLGPWHPRSPPPPPRR